VITLVDGHHRQLNGVTATLGRRRACRAGGWSDPIAGEIGNTAMNVIRSLWASIRGDPVFMRRVNGWLTVFWVIMIPVSLITGWISSVTYVAALSLWALVSGHWSAWQAARVEVRQEQEAQIAEEEPVEQRVVDKLVEETTLDVHRR
jgi:hypothetical protein